MLPWRRRRCSISGSSGIGNSGETSTAGINTGIEKYLTFIPGHKSRIIIKRGPAVAEKKPIVRRSFHFISYRRPLTRGLTAEPSQSCNRQVLSGIAMQHADDGNSRRGNFLQFACSQYALMYSADGTNVYGSRGGKFAGTR